MSAAVLDRLFEQAGVPRRSADGECGGDAGVCRVCDTGAGAFARGRRGEVGAVMVRHGASFAGAAPAVSHRCAA